MDLVYLAVRALNRYGATEVITSLALGWEQALAKAAIELGIPYTVAIPFRGRNYDWNCDVNRLYHELLESAERIHCISDVYSDHVMIEDHLWRVGRSDAVLALWDYEFQGETFSVIDYALKSRKLVINLWKDWESLFRLRRHRSSPVQQSRNGARIFYRSD
jgi:uncharacterized phage-like protein YoqJ